MSKPGSPVLPDAYSPQAAPAVLITDDTTHHTLGARDLCLSLSPVGAAAWGRGLYLPGKGLQDFRCCLAVPTTEGTGGSMMYKVAGNLRSLLGAKLWTALQAGFP